MPYLFDASALLNATVAQGRQALEIVKGQFVLDLTAYEVGNAIWGLSVLQNKFSPELVDSTIGVFVNLLEQMKELGLRDTSLASVMSIAKDERTTFYDSSYIAIAKDRTLTLVTDDRRLSKMASKYVNVKSSTSL